MSSRRRSRSALSAGAEADSGHSIGASDEESAAKCLRGEGARRASSAGQASDPTAPRVDGSEHGHASDSAAGEELAATGGHEQHLQDVPLSGTIAPQPVLVVPVVA